MFSTISLMSRQSIGRDVKRVLLVLFVAEAATLVGSVVGLVAAHAEHVPIALVEPLFPDLGRPLDDRVNFSTHLTTHSRRLSTDVAIRRTTRRHARARVVATLNREHEM